MPIGTGLTCFYFIGNDRVSNLIKLKSGFRGETRRSLTIRMDLAGVIACISRFGFFSTLIAKLLRFLQVLPICWSTLRECLLLEKLNILLDYSMSLNAQHLSC